AHDLLAPGGVLVARVPNLAFHQAVGRAARVLGPDSRAGAWLAAGVIVHQRAFSPRALRAALTRAGFAAVHVDASPPVPGDPYGTGAGAIGVVKTSVRAVTRALA